MSAASSWGSELRLAWMCVLLVLPSCVVRQDFLARDAVSGVVVAESRQRPMPGVRVVAETFYVERPDEIVDRAETSTGQDGSWAIPSFEMVQYRFFPFQHPFAEPVHSRIVFSATGYEEREYELGIGLLEYAEPAGCPRVVIMVPRSQ